MKGMLPTLDFEPPSHLSASIGHLCRSNGSGNVLEETSLRSSRCADTFRRGFIIRMVDASHEAVHERLTKGDQPLDPPLQQTLAEAEAGKQPRMQPENARRRAEELTDRLQIEPDSASFSSSAPLAGGALVIPRGWLNRLAGTDAPPEWSTDADARKRIELAAMEAVWPMSGPLASCHKTFPENRGWDIESSDRKGNLRYIEVKGRQMGCEYSSPSPENSSCRLQSTRAVLFGYRPFGEMVWMDHTTSIDPSIRNPTSVYQHQP